MTHSQMEAQQIIELYLLNRLTAEAQAEFEEHFLSCPECLEKLEWEQESIDGIREACAAVPFEPGEKRSRASGRWRLWLPLPAWGGALALGAAVVYVAVGGRPRPSVPQSQASHRAARPAPAALPVVALESYHGAAGGVAIAVSVAARPFLLRLDGRGLELYDKYSVAIVDDSGQPVWSSDAAMARGNRDWIEARVDQAPLGPGSYWVRVHGSRSGGAARLLREYSLVVRP